MRVALIYPPSADPTAPYLSVPTLSAWLRKHAVEVSPIDANVEGWEHVLGQTRALAATLERRLSRLDRKRSLSHTEQLAYLALWRARADAAEPPDVPAAIATLRDRERFYDPRAYHHAVRAIESAQRIVSAAYAPLTLDFVAYRTPFSLLSAQEIADDARPSRDPFHEYFTALADRLNGSCDVAGISVAFPAQIQPAYSLAFAIRARCPDVHVTVGGPALTQMLIRLQGERLERALGPFDSAIVYEGEVALLELVRAIERGERPRGVIRGSTIEDLSTLPPPDFDGMPLDRYFSPEPVLPYDPTRGCYWGVCTFCHYGLAEVGTARYRERPVETALDHVAALKEKHGARIFYFSQDVFSPKIALKIARGIKARGLDVRWGTDMRPERSLSAEKCRELVEGGALSAALGIESASPRVLTLIDKGIPIDAVRDAVKNLASAGVAVEAMCFSDFPSESYKEALETVRFVEGLEDELSLFILGRFDLTHGSLVAQKPGEFGIQEVWHVEGDELGTGLFWAERRPSKSGAEHEKLEEAVRSLSSAWRLRRYPWAGALSTAHTMLYYLRHGPGVFRGGDSIDDRPREHAARARFDLDACARAEEREAEIWQELVYERRRVGRAAYRELASLEPALESAPTRVRYARGVEPTGRRVSTASNATRRS